MKTTQVAALALLFLLGAGSVAAATYTVSAPHAPVKNANWAHLLGEKNSCQAPVNAFTNRTIDGFWAKKSTGQVFCMPYVNRGGRLNLTNA